LTAHKKIALGKITVHMIGEDFWRSGRLIDYARACFVRWDIPLAGKVVCIKGPASEVTWVRPTELERIGVFLNQLLDQSVDSNLQPKATLYDVARRRPVNKDAWLPLVTPGDKHSVLQLGSIAFRGKHPAAELTMDETMTLSLISGVSSQNELALEVGQPWLSQTYSALIQTADTKVHRSLTASGLDLEVVSNVKVVLSALPHPESEVKGDLEWAVSAISAEITGRGTQVLRKIQEADSDPLGLTEPGLFTSPEDRRRMRESYKTAGLRYSANVEVAILGGDR